MGLSAVRCGKVNIFVKTHDLSMPQHTLTGFWETPQPISGRVCNAPGNLAGCQIREIPASLTISLLQPLQPVASPGKKHRKRDRYNFLSNRVKLGSLQIVQRS